MAASSPQGDRKPLSPPTLEFPGVHKAGLRVHASPTEQSSFWVMGGKSGYLCPLVARVHISTKAFLTWEGLESAVEVAGCGMHWRVSSRSMLVSVLVIGQGPGCSTLLEVRSRTHRGLGVFHHPSLDP